MCGRYTIKARGTDLQRELELAHEPVIEPRYNVAPSQAAPVVLSADPHALVLAHWGFTPSWARSLTEGARHFNARGESLHEKRLFRDARRCLVICDGFFEWKQSRPFHLRSPDHRVLTMAGLWNTWRDPHGLQSVTFTIITLAADAFMSTLHSRMPAFIAKEHRRAWLGDGDALDLLGSTTLEAVEVSTHVNNAAFDDARCLEKPAATQLDLL